MHHARLVLLVRPHRASCTGSPPPGAQLLTLRSRTLHNTQLHVATTEKNVKKTKKTWWHVPHRKKIPMHRPHLSISVLVCHVQPRTHKQQVANHPTAGCGSRIQLLSRGFQPPFHSVNSASHAHTHSSVAGLIPATIG